MENIRSTVDALTQAFEAFKATNDDRFKSIEKKAADAVSDDKLKNIDQEITQLSEKLETLRVSSARPQLEMQQASNTIGDRQQAAFCDYIRKGEEQELMALEHKNLSVGSDPDGGYLVPPVIAKQIQQGLVDHSPLRRLAQVMTIASDAVEMLVDKSYADVGWVGETQPRDSTKTPPLVRKRIPVHELYAKPKATQKLLDDANINVEEWLAQKVSERMAAVENHAFLWGRGNTRPRGILSHEVEFENPAPWGKLQGFRSENEAGFAQDDGGDVLIDVVTALKPEFQAGAVWLMSRLAVSAVRKLKDRNGMYLWQPGLEGDLRAKLLGYPIEIVEQLPGVRDPQQMPSVIFGDFKSGYLIVDRQGTRILRDPFSIKPYVEFYTTRRVGGGVINFDALKVLQFSQAQ